jgi:multidrug resistance efflux pump
MFRLALVVTALIAVAAAGWGWHGASVAKSTVARVVVAERVEEGALLARLDDEEARARFEQAQANVDAALELAEAADADVRVAEAKAVAQARVGAKALVDPWAIVAQARARASAANAQVDAAMAARDVAALELKRATIYAPHPQS